MSPEINGLNRQESNKKAEIEVSLLFLGTVKLNTP